MPQIEIPKLSGGSRIQTRPYDFSNSDFSKWANAIVDLLVPTGTIVPTALKNEPSSAWKMLNGQSLHKDEWPRLYAIFGGEYGEDLNTFTLPDMGGKTLIGTDAEAHHLGVTGSNSITLSIAQLPSHQHVLTDPGHAHSFTAAPHSHSLNDPGHAHQVDSFKVSNSGGSAGGERQVTPEKISQNVSSANANITISNATAGGTVAKTNSNITMAKTGGNQPIDITPRALLINWMVRA